MTPSRPAAGLHVAEPSVVERYHRTPSGPQDPLFRLVEHIRPGATVLDIGTAAGALAGLLAQRGCVVDGVERDLGAAAMARPLYRRFIVADLDISTPTELLPPAAYDHVVCADVVEHLRRPERHLRACRRLLRPGGSLLLSFPNLTFAPLIAELLAGRFVYRHTGLLDRTHVRLWTLASLRQLAADTGFTLRAVEGIERFVHESEFDGRYLEALPPEVAAFLGSVEGATVYQWLLILSQSEGATDDVSPPPPSKEHLEVKYPLALLWRRDGEGFDSTRATTAYAVACGGRQKIQITLPSELDQVAGLALGMAPRPATVELLALELYGADGSLLWALDGARLASLQWHGTIPAAGEHGGALLAFSSLGGGVGLPASEVGPIGGGARLSIDLHWPEAAEVLPGLYGSQRFLTRLFELQQGMEALAASGSSSPELASLRDRVEAQAAESASLRGIVATLTAERDSLRVQTAAVAAERDELATRFAALASERQELGERLDAVAADRDDLRDRLDATATERDTLGLRLDEATTERDRLLRHLDETTTERDALRQRLDDAATELGTLQKRVDELVVTASGLSSRLEELAAERASLRQDLGLLRADLAWMTSTAAWRWRERLLASRALTAVYRLLKRVSGASPRSSDT